MAYDIFLAYGIFCCRKPRVGAFCNPTLPAGRGGLPPFAVNGAGEVGTMFFSACGFVLQISQLRQMREKVAVGRLTLRPDFYYNKCVAFPAFVQRASTVAKGALPIRCGLAQIRIKPPQNHPMFPGRLRPWDGDVFMTHFIKRTWAEIDLDAAAHNFYCNAPMPAGERAVVAVVKADAYGHGAARMARLYDALGVERFAVWDLEEAAELRRAGLRQPTPHPRLYPGGGGGCPPQMRRDSGAAGHGLCKEACRGGRAARRGGGQNQPQAGQRHGTNRLRLPE